ncbi:guanylin-like [Pristis pectinata]|uniref:guanylin-like n=1 Tax=Pristis pectinata TaxID=685728 RepID=UPI00223D0F0C|nr:guanylin-like [Pristis pectinata]
MVQEAPDSCRRPGEETSSGSPCCPGNYVALGPVLRECTADGNYTFPLEDVKQLWALMDTLVESDPVVASSVSTGLCLSPELPKVFRPVCTSRDANQVFLRLEEIAQKADVCEICAYAACSGCESVGQTLNQDDGDGKNGGSV